MRVLVGMNADKLMRPLHGHVVCGISWHTLLP